MELIQLHPNHYWDLYGIAKRVEPYIVPFMPYLEKFKAIMAQREGWTLMNEGRPVGAITISGYEPGKNAVIHVFIEEPFHRSWNTLEINRVVFGYCFNDLKLPRVTGFCIAGVNDYVARFQEKLGFRHEGVMRKGIELADGFHDLILCGMLREECPWL